jgi:Peptidase family S41
MPRSVPTRTRANRSTTLTWAQRYDIIDAWQLLLSELYVHLPLKRALYGYDPVRALEALRRQVPLLNDAGFHRELASAINRLRDAHTQHFNSHFGSGVVARLPFLVESYGSPTEPRFVVGKVADRSLLPARSASFAPGTELLTWNGVPFERVVDRHAEGETGGRPDARRARALESLTFRSLMYAPMPEESWVDITYRNGAGEDPKAIRLEWEVIDTDRASASGTGSPRNATALHSAAERVRRAKKLTFNPAMWELDHGPTATHARASTARVAAKPLVGETIDTSLQDFLTAKVIGTRTKPIAYLRIWSFDIDDDQVFVDEIARMLRLLPEIGLIIDLRANPGGNIIACERVLQLLTTTHIVPARFAMRATPLTAQLASTNPDLAPWADSLTAALSTNEQFSQPIPISDEAACNDTGRQYFGPSLCVVDANTYSCGDLFTAGFADHQIGPIVTVGAATGAGGANVWGHNDIRAAFSAAHRSLPALPDGVGFTMAIRRMIRVGPAEGLGIEDVGINGITYDMTKRDILESNTDMLRFCSDILHNE